MDICEQIVAAISKSMNAENPAAVQIMRIPGGPEVGRQFMIDAPKEDGLMNRARLSLMNPDLAPAGEVARIEYESDKQGRFGVKRVYSIQSVRRHGSDLELLENFLAESAATVREDDFRPIESAEYARDTVLKSVQSWVDYRAWQLRAGRVG